MSDGQVAAAVIALAVSGAAVVAFVVTARRRNHGPAPAGVETEVRQIVFRAIEEGDLPPEVVQALTPVQRGVLERQARALLPSLRGQDREALGRVLDRIGAVDTARRQTRSTRAVVRAQAGEFLGESGSPEAVRDLLQLLQDADPKVRWAAARGLGRLGHPSAVVPLLSAVEGPCAVPVDVVADAVFAIRYCPVPVLRQGLASPSVPTRALTVELLGRFQALAAADELIGLLHDDPSVEVRARAARALGRLGSPRAVQPLLAAVERGPVAMRAQAIWALGEIGAVEALPVLRATLLGPARHLGELAADALAAMGPRGLRALTEVAAGDGGASAIAVRALTARRTLQSSTA